jgi:hypothetical protein
VLRPIGMATMMVAPPEVQRMMVVAISMTAMVMMMVISRMRFGISAKSHKREQSYYCSSHQLC